MPAESDKRAIAPSLSTPTAPDRYPPASLMRIRWRLSKRSPLMNKYASAGAVCFTDGNPSGEKG
ncbi:MAG: hypothetical protein LBT43_04365 [Prevotella sp.]|nr:hypothetical protein [Prevotella sp.]